MAGSVSSLRRGDTSGVGVQADIDQPNRFMSTRPSSRRCRRPSNSSTFVGEFRRGYELDAGIIVERRQFKISAKPDREFPQQEFGKRAALGWICAGPEAWYVTAATMSLCSCTEAMTEGIGTSFNCSQVERVKNRPSLS